MQFRLHSISPPPNDVPYSFYFFSCFCLCFSSFPDATSFPPPSTCVFLCSHPTPPVFISFLEEPILSKPSLRGPLADHGFLHRLWSILQWVPKVSCTLLFSERKMTTETPLIPGACRLSRRWKKTPPSPHLLPNTC